MNCTAHADINRNSTGTPPKTPVLMKGNLAQKEIPVRPLLPHCTLEILTEI